MTDEANPGSSDLLAMRGPARVRSASFTGRVVLIGNLAGTAYAMLRPLARKGIDARLFVSRAEKTMALPQWEDPELKGSRPDWLHVYGPAPGGSALGSGSIIRRLQSLLARIDTARRLLGADLIHSFTGSLFQSWLWVLLFGVLKLKPYIACATGSDIRELAQGSGARSVLMRLYFRRAARTLLLNLDMGPLADGLGLSNAEFFPFAIDTRKYSPQPVARRYGQEGELLFFMPSHLDWGVTDDAPGRNSTKGNDRFLRAFARALAEGARAHLVLLDRGPDRLVARELIEELGIAKSVTFLGEMPKNELVELFRMADVVVDQFDVGAFGATGLEAMACGKPVMIHINDQCAARCYAELPPVLNCRSEAEILDAIRRARDVAWREEIGQKARAFIVRHHDAEAVGDRLIELYARILAGGAQGR